MSWPKVILFGDSLTQRSFDPSLGCWASMLADRYQRRADVIVRGFSGYNSRWCRMIMPKIFEKFDPNEIFAIVILLGTNDSVPVHCDSGQHVPIEEYRGNLKFMIDYLQMIGFGPEKLILMAPPNFYHDDFKQWCKTNNRISIPDDWPDQIKHYVEACKSVAIEKQITSIDLYEIFINNPNNRNLFMDGLHLSREGAKLLFDNLSILIDEKLERFNLKSMEPLKIFPYWNEIDKNHPEKSLLCFEKRTRTNNHIVIHSLRID
ncbi:Isoamyl acetate-hydrolyzing esterase 1 -like protein [Sarcoptes scabiei]|uniref:Isoamyl acetate-hydrolyzing esterase 1 -like protein n=1 Tax=Sarcoptes scabiei TaxID=52283 RepID=A0A834R4P2_SARSC|nr:Isoamyl acetate-hydrolyzing esterase 1 -like protein [Sarcoptes scabiei]